MGSGGTFWMVTDDSETFRTDNLESEIAGGACATYIYLSQAGHG